MITAKMRCCILLFYYDLLDSTIGVMSYLFCIVNSIRPLCILLCDIRYCILLFEHDVLNFCGDDLLFLFCSVRVCILLCNPTFFYALIYVIIQDWVTFGIFAFCFAFPYYNLFHFVNRSCIMFTSSPAWHLVDKN